MGRTPDIIADVTLLAAAKGGRASPTPPTYLGCPAKIGNEYFDCRIYLDGRAMAPGESRQKLKIYLLSPKFTKGLLKVGNTIALWEGKEIGSATIVGIPG